MWACFFASSTQYLKLPIRSHAPTYPRIISAWSRSFSASRPAPQPAPRIHPIRFPHPACQQWHAAPPPMELGDRVLVLVTAPVGTLTTWAAATHHPILACIPAHPIPSHPIINRPARPAPHFTQTRPPEHLSHTHSLHTHSKHPLHTLSTHSQTPSISTTHLSLHTTIS